jgi:hypothetical protein
MPVEAFSIETKFLKNSSTHSGHNTHAHNPRAPP